MFISVVVHLQQTVSVLNGRSQRQALTSWRVSFGYKIKCFEGSNVSDAQVSFKLPHFSPGLK